MNVENQYIDLGSQVTFLKQNKLLPKRYEKEFDPTKPLRKGLTAYMFCRALGIKGGIMLRLFGMTERYAIKELVHQGMMSSGDVDDIVTGEELIYLVTQAGNYMAKKQEQAAKKSKKMQRQDVEKVSLVRQTDNVQSKKDEIREEIEKLRKQTNDLNEEIWKLKEEKQKISNDNQMLAKRLTTLQLKSERDMRRYKIKVLSGNGNLNSARRMAKRLRKMGYEIKFIDRAPQSTFVRNTVFFAPEVQDEAERLVSSLGGDSITKPLTWPSIFDLIVVSGRD
jgi:predicted RNase H-like nuclease (RuvC/YqgF family)